MPHPTIFEKAIIYESIAFNCFQVAYFKELQNYEYTASLNYQEELSRYNKMFCFQCEQTAGCKGCMGVTGVCGKKADTAELQDKLTGALIGLARATEGNEDMVNAATDRLVLDGLFTTITNVNFNNDTINTLIGRVNAEKERLVPNCLSCSSPCGRNDNFT